MSKKFSKTLDPDDWEGFRVQGHRMLDGMLDYLESIRARPVWQPIPGEVRESMREPLPSQGEDLDGVYRRFLESVLPYTAANAHPGFFGWVQGGGTPVGMLAEMLAAGLNANVGGRDQMPVEVERQVVRWMAELFDFPDSAGGLFVTGTSMANFIALLVARTRALGDAVREHGLAASGGAQLVAYTSEAAHGCVAQAMELAGFGRAALRMVALNERFEMDAGALELAIQADLAAGLRPFFVAATAGTVDVGAVDDLIAIGAIARRHGAWFHVDGAYGALARLSAELAPRLAGIEQADSIAFDFHKWGQVPYDAGFVLVRDGAAQQAAFAAPAAYLRRDARGLSAGSPWPCDLGPDLSRGFRALKAWFTIKVYGSERLGEAIAESCAIARYLADQVALRPALELLAPVSLNIVCFRYRGESGAADDQLNAALVADLQESGVAAPSLTTVRGRLAIRAAVVNHRTQRRDIDAMLDALQVMAAARLPAGVPAPSGPAAA